MSKNHGMPVIVLLTAILSMHGAAFGQTPDACGATYSHTRAERLVKRARAIQKLEERETADLISDSAALDVTPERDRSTRVLQDALRADRSNLAARCLLAQNLIDTARLSDGRYDCTLLGGRLAPELDRIIALASRRPVNADERRELHRLLGRVKSELVDATEGPDTAPIRAWWYAQELALGW